MASKVFLFGDNNWLYCSDVSYNNGNWRGWVVNGNWHLMYDTKSKSLLACVDAAHANSLVAVTKARTELTWACDADLKNVGQYYYNEVIHDAQTRYKNGEPANYAIQPKEVQPKKVDEEYELYLKLRDKYDPFEDDIPF